VFALEGGAAPLLMVYDLDRNAVPYVALLGAQAAAGATVPPPPQEQVLRVADTPSAPALTRAPAPAVPAVIRLKPIAFAFDDATLSDAARATLQSEGLPKIVAIREVRYVVRGHADRLGSPRYNQRLSERRAQAVRAYLIDKGVPAQNIEAIGLGASQPEASCPPMRRRALIDCLAPDRRVSIEIQPPPM
jgi:OOP family OmpA-OmpF porin